MLNLILCELKKLKRAKMMIFTILGTQAVPVMIFIEALQQHAKNPEQIITLDHIFQNSLLYVMLLMNNMIFVAISAYLFSREYLERTLKNLIPLPISRTRYITGKFLTLLLLIIILTIVTWVGILGISLMYHIVFELDHFSLIIALQWLWKMIFGGLLMFLTISPFAYGAEKTKGLVVPMITMAVIVMASAALTNQEIGALYPWTATYFLIIGRLKETGYPIWLSLAIILLESVIGFLLTYIYFQKEDLK